MHLTITSKAGDIYNGDVTKITLQTSSGIIQILPNHQNLVSILAMGEVSVLDSKNEIERIAVSGGVVEVNEKGVVILADEADLTKQLVAAEIDAAINLAKEKLANMEPATPELIQLEKQLRYQLFKRDMLE